MTKIYEHGAPYLWLGLALLGCGGPAQDSASATMTGVTTATTPGTTTATTGDATGTPTSTTGEASGGSQGDTLKLDVAVIRDFDPTGGGPASCEVLDDMNGVGECGKKAPPDSFEPAIQWTWTAPGDVYSIVTPLVANFTDDNGDGVIDLCDIPDILIVATPELANPQPPGHIYLLDGATGSVHYKIEDNVADSVTPAIGDIDGDGLVEIVTLSDQGTLVAYEHDGTPKWSGFKVPGYNGIGGAVALGDVDNDGDVEIVYDDVLADHQGLFLWEAKLLNVICPATALADLDDDGDLEIVFGNAAFHHDGTPLYNTPGIEPGFPQIANLDADPQPEVLIANTNGITLLDHDGTVQYKDLRPTGDPADGLNWSRPATVHDFDGDGVAEYALSSSAHYSVFERDGKVRWTVNISDPTGIAAGTAFDFLGDGGAEAMYADEQNLFIYDDKGGVELMASRTSRTLIEYPVVVDVDNDGSAEIIVVSNETTDNVADGITVQVIRDKQDRWIQARRIWNQHTYHVTKNASDRRTNRSLRRKINVPSEMHSRSAAGARRPATCRATRASPHSATSSCLQSRPSAVVVASQRGPWVRRQPGVAPDPAIRVDGGARSSWSLWFDPEGAAEVVEVAEVRRISGEDEGAALEV